MEMNLAKDVKGKMKGFYKYIGDKSKMRENVGRLLSGAETVVTWDMEKTETLNAFFASLFASEARHQKSQRPEGRGWRKEDVPLGAEDCILLSKLGVHMSIGPYAMHPKVIRELADVIARPLPIIFDQSRQPVEVSKDCRKGDITPIFKKSKKEDAGNYRLVSLTLIPRKVIEQLILETISRHMMDKKVIRRNQPGFTKERLCLTNLLNFYD